MAGRRPKPRALKLVTGNPGKRKLRDDEPEGVPGWPDVPNGLRKVARGEWERLGKLLEDEGRLTLSDGPTLMGAAISYESALEFERFSRQRKLPYDEWRKFKTGARMQWDAYRKFVNDLCLSAGTRARAQGPRKPKQTRLEAFEGRKRPAAG